MTGEEMKGGVMEEVDGESSNTRSHRIKAKTSKSASRLKQSQGGANWIQAVSKFDKGDTVWVVIDGKPGSFKMKVEDEPVQNPITKSWSYQLRDSENVIFEGGKLVPEGKLNSKAG